MQHPDGLGLFLQAYSKMEVCGMMFATDTWHITNMQSNTNTITPVLIHKSYIARSQVVFYEEVCYL